MEATPQQIKQFHVLLYRTHMMDSKKDMIASYGVESTKDLTFSQINKLIIHLQSIESEAKAEKDKKIRAWRHKVLRMVAECDVDTKDWNKVNAFLLQPRIAGKHLYECGLDELQNLHRKLHNVAANKKKENKSIRMQMLMN